MSASYDPLVDGNPSSVTQASIIEEFKRLESYPWTEDMEFQAGLSSILGSQSGPHDQTQLEDLALRARCFYFSRKYNVTVDPAAYLAWRIAQPPQETSPLLPNQTVTAPAATPNGEHSSMSSTGQPAPSQSSASTLQAQPPQQPPYSASFEEIVRLIQSGEPIPGIKDIPDTVLAGQGSEETQPQRRKPWENRT